MDEATRYLDGPTAIPSLQSFDKNVAAAQLVERLPPFVLVQTVYPEECLAICQFRLNPILGQLDVAVECF